jgi:hypothetical protein
MGKRGRLVAAPLPMYVRRRPTLPQPLGCSTIGAERLNFRVRYGTGCFPFAMAAVTLAEHTHPRLLVWGCSKLLVIRIQLTVGSLVSDLPTPVGVWSGNYIVDAVTAIISV